MGILKKLFKRGEPKLLELSKEQEIRLTWLHKAGTQIYVDKKRVKRYYKETRKLMGQGFDVSPHDIFSELHYREAFKEENSI